MHGGVNMPYFYSASTNGFYHDLVHHTMPDDAKEISDADYSVATEGLSRGAQIKPGDISFVVVEPPALDTTAIRESDKRLAFSQESDPLFFKWQRGEATQQEWLDKINEIKERFA